MMDALFLLICFIITLIAGLRRGREIRCTYYGSGGIKTISYRKVARNLPLLLLVAFILGMAPDAAGLDPWLTPWFFAGEIVSWIIYVVLLLLLIAFCIIVIKLLK